MKLFDKSAGSRGQTFGVSQMEFMWITSFAYRGFLWYNSFSNKNKKYE